MWKQAAAITILTMAGATAHAQQQRSPIENLDKTISELAQEGYEIKAAEGLSDDIPSSFCKKSREYHYLPNQLFHWRRILFPT
jgi:hypothetical protein